MSGLKYFRPVYLEHLLNPPEEHHVPAFQLSLDTLEFHGKSNFKDLAIRAQAYLLIHPEASPTIVTPRQSPLEKMPSVRWVPGLPEQFL